MADDRQTRCVRCFGHSVVRKLWSLEIEGVIAISLRTVTL